jgi:hypothetical protein
LLESQINLSSKKKAKQYLQDSHISSSLPLQFHQVYLVYKFLDTPLNLIIEGMRSKSPSDLRSFYKNIARQLHPDKNSHPMAKEAF